MGTLGDMRWKGLMARLRRPLTVTASVAVAAGVMLPTGAQVPVAPTVSRVVATPVPVPVFTPSKLVIPRIDLEAPIVPVGTEPDGTMSAPKTAHDVGWWQGRKAGEGNVLLDGHHDWNGRFGSFYRLPELKAGDKIIIYGSNKKKVLTYKLVWLKNYDRNIDATDLLGNKSGKQIATLITCAGVFDVAAGTRSERAVARAELVSA
jgi:LPXTG-site transpeptidase (sortase) family protein